MVVCLVCLLQVLALQWTGDLSRVYPASRSMADAIDSSDPELDKMAMVNERLNIFGFRALSLNKQGQEQTRTDISDNTHDTD